MFTGFMIDASNLFKFERKQNGIKGSFSVEFWIFKPAKSGQQVYCYEFNIYE